MQQLLKLDIEAIVLIARGTLLPFNPKKPAKLDAVEQLTIMILLVIIDKNKPILLSIYLITVNPPNDFLVLFVPTIVIC